MHLSKLGGIKNFCNDLFKGRDRYKNYTNYKFNIELLKSPEPDIKTLMHGLVIISKRDESMIFGCRLSESPLNNMDISKYELDQYERINHQKLIQELQALNVKYKDIELITNTINQKDLENANLRS